MKSKKIISYGAGIPYDAEADQYYRAAKKFKRPGDVKNWMLRSFDEFWNYAILGYFEDGTWEIFKEVHYEVQTMRPAIKPHSFSHHLAQTIIKKGGDASDVKKALDLPEKEVREEGLSPE